MAKHANESKDEDKSTVEEKGENRSTKAESISSSGDSGTGEEKPKAEPRAKKFVVLDGNGKVFREVKTREEAVVLAKHIQGRVQ